MNEHTWNGLVEAYISIERKRKADSPPPASEAELKAMLEAAKPDGLHIPNEYVDLLRIRNGTSFNGLMLYAADIRRTDKFRRGDMIVMNQYHWTRGEATVLGTSDIDLYVVADANGPYRRLDRPSWDVIDEYATCDELLTSIFERQLESLNDV